MNSTSYISWIRWIILGVVCTALGAAAALSHRYEFVQVGSTLARCDRFTGTVVFIGQTGQELGGYPSFDPIRDGQAVLVRK